MLDPAGGDVVWELPVDAAVTGNPATLEDIGADGGYLTELCLAGGVELVAVGLDERVLLLDAGDGTVRSVLEVAGAVTAVRPDPGGGALLAATGGGLLRVPLA